MVTVELPTVQEQLGQGAVSGFLTHPRCAPARGRIGLRSYTQSPRNLRKFPCEFSFADKIISKTTAYLKGTKNMEQIRAPFKMISAMALLALTVGCATTSSTQNKESMLVASGFKTVTPKTAAQQQKLQQLPPGKVAMINRKGRTYYIFPDAAHNQAYVGGPQEYQAYQQLRAANKLAQENLESAEMYNDASMNWGAWGGWGMGWGPMGMGVGVRRF